ncbi:MAG TPA: FtsX-like permease family protein [Acidimicrobiia bacterium]|nr:FtsX-like permease family protein [Acidimicrobiia bacterium]
MPYLSFALRNLRAKKGRSLGLAAAVAFAVMTVVTLAVTSSGLEQSAAAVISIGKADFTVAQKDAPNLLASTIDAGERARILSTPGVESAVGVLVETERINANNPVFIEIGIAPGDLARFGVNIVAGRPYQATARSQCMLGWRAASNLGLHVGSKFSANGTVNTVTGLYSTGNSFGDDAAMFPLPAVQGYNRVPGIVTMVFVKVHHGYSESGVEHSIAYRLPELTTIRTATQFGRADRDLVYLQAAVTGSTILAVIIGAVIVGNTMLLSVFERTRELGLLRAVGWTRRRIVGLILLEALALALLGACVGVGLSFAVTGILEHVPRLSGVLHTDFTPTAFWRALYTALGMTLLGCLYPAIRAAFLVPLKALSYE